MKNKRTYKIKSILFKTLWLSAGLGTLVLLVAGIHKNEAEHCKAVMIDIRGVNNNFFVDQSDVRLIIDSISRGEPIGKTVSSFNLRVMERELRKNTWIKTAELFFDNNAVLQVKIEEREPVGRVFTTTGNTFYIDGDDSVLPLSDKFSARLPVFTGFPSDNKMLSASDSNLLADIKMISLIIQKDSFLMAMIDQVDITPIRNFEMIPKIGNQVIIFGDASGAAEKFRKLKLFYKEIMAKRGWNRYSVIDVQYKNQVVAKRRGAEEDKADSLRALELIQLNALKAEKMAGDSVLTMPEDNERGRADSAMIQQSIQREEIPKAVMTKKNDH